MPGVRHDFAVVGAGIAGASLAAALAPHARVILLEGERLAGYHATGRSAAFWAESYGGPGVQPLTTASRDALAAGGFLRPRGALYLATAADERALYALAVAFADAGVRLIQRDRAALTARVPGLIAGWVAGVEEPDCQDIDVAALHAHYLATARRNGAALVTGARITAARCSGTGWDLATTAGAFQADRLVDAAGAWADDLARVAGVRPLGMMPLRRTVAQLRTRPASPADLPLVLGIDGSFYFKPEPGGRLWLSPHDETPSPPCDAAAEEIDVARAIARFETVVDWSVEAVERRWAGLRTFARDRLPVIGADPANARFIWFAGQGGFGIQTAPAAAALAAALLIGGEAPRGVDPRRYDPARFCG